jgi:hypothetical protein
MYVNMLIENLFFPLLLDCQSFSPKPLLFSVFLLVRHLTVLCVSRSITRGSAAKFKARLIANGRATERRARAVTRDKYATKLVVCAKIPTRLTDRASANREKEPGLFRPREQQHCYYESKESRTGLPLFISNFTWKLSS